MIRVLLNHVLPFALGLLAGVAAFYLVIPFDVPASDSGSVAERESRSDRCRRDHADRIY